MELIKASALTDVKGFLSEARPRKLRSMRQFAEEEIVLPSGPFAGSRFRVSRQPFTGLWFDQVDSGLYTKHVATGPTQSGKSLSCFIIPVLYHCLSMPKRLSVVCRTWTWLRISGERTCCRSSSARGSKTCCQ